MIKLHGLFPHGSWFWHVKPVYGGGQVHLYVPPKLLHIPLFEQGFGLQISYWNN